MEEYADISTLLDPAPVERIFLDGAPPFLEIPIPAVEDTPLIKVEEHRIEENSVTMIETSSSIEMGFSIYAVSKTFNYIHT